jgi:hypothetical protein
LNIKEVARGFAAVRGRSFTALYKGNGENRNARGLELK